MSSEINFSGNVQNVLTGDINNSTVNINSQSGQERTLSEAAAEIQLLLKQLEKEQKEQEEDAENSPESEDS